MEDSPPVHNKYIMYSLPPPTHTARGGHRKGWTLKPMYIKLPMYLFFYMALQLDDFDAENIYFSTFLGPNGMSEQWPL
jgi:hypothetical protein